MRAVIQDRYGSPDHLRIADVAVPEPAADQALVRVHASSANAVEWRRVRGAPFLLRLSEGVRRPRSPFLGGDAAGVVERVGGGVEHLAVGDEVWGIRTGAYAEYVAGKAFVRKPASIGWEEAAAVPTAGVTALQAVRDHGRVAEGARVLVNGAGGGVGTMAVQIARAYGADVTAVTGPATLEMVRGLGVAEVVDYTRDDFTRLGRRFDVVIDLGGNRTVRAMRRVVAPGGRLVLAGAGAGRLGPMTRLFGATIRSRLLRQGDVKSFVAGVDRSDLDELRDLVEAGRLRPVIDRTYPLERVAEALRHVEEGRARGKVVISIR